MKFWKKEKAKSTNPFETDSDNSSQYSYTATLSEPTEKPSRYSSSAKSNRYSTPSPEPIKNYSQNRRNLFDGVTEPTQRYDTSGQEDAYSSSKLNDNEEDQEVAQIQRQIRNVKQDSLASTRNALQKIGEAETAATNTMGMLGTQSSQIANVDRNLDLSKAYSDKASSQAGELKQLNRSIFIPVIKNPFNKSSREKKAMEKINREHQDHLKERDDIRKFEYESNARFEDTQRKVNHEKITEDYHRGRTQSDRHRYQFEPDEEDDAIEDEIDSNLDLLGDATARLRTMAVSMNEELGSQNKQLNKLNKKVDPISTKLISTTHTLDSTK
ncbi:hypothetical protein INT48_003195 [Thamnidium elegans]|uniref:t-SNARE coiled-coil homology domain-containing protein n=1 Tax=Thamnidium elegans TaxID=101142 RepID=A0A8H7SMV9_9FUNG|nr:hypothetical protein INT48_003195 [Thamnidium elegans]